jgi:hypothetical protein
VQFAVSILMVLLFVSGSIILDGWLGRMRNSHPHCRACGYDLIGSWETSGRCPECGAELSTADSVKWGAADRNWPRFWIGVMLLTATIFVLLVVLSRPA